MMRETENTLLTEREAADFFGWSIYTMREIRKRGEIEFLRFHDRTIRYTLEQLEDYKLRHMSRAAEAKEGADDER
jgi:repressor of nif and glnA expression